MAIGLELSANQVHHERTILTLLDVLSDLGGLVEVVFVAFSLVLSVFNYKNLTNYMASQLFRIAPKRDSENSKELKPTLFCNIAEFCMDKFLKFPCCRKRGRWRAMQRARKLLQKDMNIIEIMRLILYLRVVVDKVLSPEEKARVLKQHKYRLVEDQDEKVIA